jgi:hypothetical protein
MTLYNGPGRVLNVTPRAYVVQLADLPAVVNVARSGGAPCVPWGARFAAGWSMRPCMVRLQRWCVKNNSWEGEVDLDTLASAERPPHTTAHAAAHTTAHAAAHTTAHAAAHTTAHAAALSVAPLPAPLAEPHVQQHARVRTRRALRSM